MEQQQNKADNTYKKYKRKLAQIKNNIHYARISIHLNKLTDHTASIYNGDLREYLLNLQLPKGIIDLTRRREYCYSFLLQTGIFGSDFYCKHDNQLMEIRMTLDQFYRFMCPICTSSRDIREGTIWPVNSSSLDLRSAVIAIFSFAFNLRTEDLDQIMGYSKPMIRFLSKTLSAMISHWYTESLEPFTGVVEIDESKFAKDSVNGAWVFGLLERHSKRTYMEVVKKRDEATLLGIISKICAPGTTIVSDQWAAYNKIEEMGYYHYTVDHSRFFVNPHNREINTQNIELSWLWAKRDIRLRQSIITTNLQELLHEHCWRRQFKGQAKDLEIVGMIHSLCQVLKEYREGNVVFKDFVLPSSNGNLLANENAV